VRQNKEHINVGNEEQIDYWNGQAGEQWARDDDFMARLLFPISEALLDHAPLENCRSALDIGCGGGSQSLMLAQRLSSSARVLGVDISGPMLEVASAKINTGGTNCAELDFLQADAASQHFDPNSFDLLFSRFGVMFFDDPLAAFTNLRSALTPGGRLAFSCWQAMKSNEWTWLPLKTALQHLPPPEPPVPNAPGPFAFANPARLESILSDAGFSDIALQPCNTTLRFGEAATLTEAVQQFTGIGPINTLLQDQSPAALDKVYPALEKALQPYFREGALELDSAFWLVTATSA
jgi:SAM-dependent methyltransferase